MRPVFVVVKHTHPAHQSSPTPDVPPVAGLPHRSAIPRLYVFTHANWWKNLRSDTPITLRLQGKDVQGLPETVSEDKKAVAADLVYNPVIHPAFIEKQGSLNPFGVV